VRVSRKRFFQHVAYQNDDGPNITKYSEVTTVGVVGFGCCSIHCQRYLGLSTGSSNTDDVVIKKERGVYIKIGNHDRSSFLLPAFYREVVELLELLAKIGDESLGLSRCHQKLVLHLKTRTNPKRTTRGRQLLNQPAHPGSGGSAKCPPDAAEPCSLRTQQFRFFKRINEVTMAWHAKCVKPLFKDDPDGFKFYKRAEMYEINNGNESDGSQS
jgi:hypothetical protein